MKKYIVLPLLLVLVIAASANAKHGHGQDVWKWWENDDITEQINLTGEQSEQIRGIYESYKPRLEKLGNTYREKKTAYYGVMSNPEADRAKVLRAFDAMSEAKYEAYRAKLDMKLDMRQVLTPDQINGVNDIVESWREKHYKK